MMLKQHFSICWRCILGYFSYAVILYITLGVITLIRISEPTLPATMEHGGYFVYH